MTSPEALGASSREKIELKNPSLLHTKAFLGGKWAEADDGAVITVANPATGGLLGTVPEMKSGETRRGIEVAYDAWPAWRAQTASKRSTVLRDFYGLILENSDDLAHIITAEQGKTLAEAKAEVQYAASFLEWFGEEAKRVYGDTVPSPATDKRIIVTREPIGVCAAITPWNFPAAMITRKVAPALAAGCTIVVKPAEATPLTALALADLANRAGVPSGVLSVITGDPVVIGAELTSNPIVRKLSFTGSTAVGRLLMAQSAPTVKKLSLELGGNAPFIVFDDADIDAAVEGAVASKYRNSGQTCVCANRFFVQQSVHDLFVEKLCAAVRKMKVGRGTDSDVTLGPLINQAAISKVQACIQDASERGARVLTGGKLHVLGCNFFEPTVVTGVTPDMKLSYDEIFGPVAAVSMFGCDDEVIHLANATEAGLAAYFYSRDIRRIWRVAESLEYGMVGINTGHISNEVAPFGGVKQSGFGREGSHFGMDDYLNIKYLCLGNM